MSSIIRWQRGLVVATWGSCPERADVTITSSEALAQDPCRCSRTAGSFNTSVRPQQGRQHPIRKRKTYDEYVGEVALETVGRWRWTKRVRNIIG